MRRFFTQLSLVFVLLCLFVMADLPRPVNAASISDLTYKIQSHAVFITDCKTTATGNLVIPSHIGGYPVVSIADGAFADCTRLTSITLPEGYITWIPQRAFAGCTSLTSVTIPNGVTTINFNAFDGCTNLSTIILPDSITSIDRYAFEDTAYYNNPNNWEDSVLYIGNHLIKAKDTVSGNYSIKPGTKSIANSAFASRKNLTSITIPNSITAVGYGAFSGCSGLSTIDLPSSITRLENYAFSDCTGISSITIPKTITAIYYGTFSGCSNLTSISLSKETTAILSGAFHNCESMTDIWYSGTESNRQQIRIEDNNIFFSNATWHYNCCSEHSFDNACDSQCNCCDYVRVASKHIFDNGCDSVCNICSSIRNTSHSYDNACDPTCNTCGSSRTTSHSYDNACDDVCNICSSTRTVPHQYSSSWSKDTSGHWKTCALCGNKADQAAHTPSAAATETTAQTCTTCSYVIKAALNHTHSYDASWSKDASGHWHACACGGQNDYAVHSYKNTCDADCDICGHARTVAHAPIATTTATTDQICTTCGTVLNNAASGTHPDNTFTEPSSTETQPTELTTQPSADPAAPSGTDIPTTPDATSYTEPSETSPALIEPDGGSEDTSGAIWIIVSVAVVLLGGGGTAGWFFWKKKHE